MGKEKISPSSCKSSGACNEWTVESHERLRTILLVYYETWPLMSLDILYNLNNRIT